MLLGCCDHCAAWVPVQGLGLEYARALVAAGCRCLVLTSRYGALPPETLRELAEAGVAAFAVAADAGDASAASAVLGWARERLPAAQHHAHAAGVSGLAPLGDMSDAQLWGVLAPKVCGLRDRDMPACIAAMHRLTLQISQGLRIFVQHSTYCQANCGSGAG